MKPTLVTPAGAVFPLLSVKGIHKGLAFIFSQFRIYGAPGETPRLYNLTGTGSTYTDPLTNNTGIVFQNLQCMRCGFLIFDTIYNLLTLSSESTARTLNNMYQSDMSLRIAQKKKTISHEIWFHRQYDIWIRSGYGILDAEPFQVSFDPAEYCYAYIDQSTLTPGPTPSWDAFESQMEPTGISKQFEAFIWASLDRHNEGRQMIYCYDKAGEGGTGKTSVSNALSAGLLEQVTGALNEDVIKNEFGFAQIYGKRLLIVGDCKNDKIIKNQKLHAITGGDLCSVVYKGKMAFFAKVYARVLIFSNDAPTLDVYRGHEKSRVIIIRLDPKLCKEKRHYNTQGQLMGDNNYVARLIAELPHFLHRCRENYETLCPSHREIQVSDDMFANVNSTEEEIFVEFFDSHLETAEPASYLRSIDVYTMLTAQLQSEWGRGSNSNALMNFKLFLSSKNIHQTRKTIDGKKVRIFTGIKKKGEASAMLGSEITLDMGSSAVDDGDIIVDLAELGL